MKLQYARLPDAEGCGVNRELRALQGDPAIG